MSERTPHTLVDSRTHARDVLIGYLSAPQTETDETLRDAIEALAKELDVSYENAWRYLLVGAVA